VEWSGSGIDHVSTKTGGIISYSASQKGSLPIERIGPPTLSCKSPSHDVNGASCAVEGHIVRAPNKIVRVLGVSSRVK